MHRYKYHGIAVGQKRKGGGRDGGGAKRVHEAAS